MLRNVLVITDGGLVLFSKVNVLGPSIVSCLVLDGKIQEFVNALAQPRLVGSLLTAILEVRIVSFSALVLISRFRNCSSVLGRFTVFDKQCRQVT